MTALTVGNDAFRVSVHIRSRAVLRFQSPETESSRIRTDRNHSDHAIQAAQQHFVWLIIVKRPVNHGFKA